MEPDPLVMLSAARYLNDQRPEWVRLAREQGATWEQIADASGLSVSGVRKLSVYKVTDVE